MQHRSAVTLIVLSCLMVAACGGDKKPGGQVVATVDKEEITAIDLKNEMAGFSTADPKIRQAAERQALDAIITRKILAKAAKDAKVNKTPQYAQQEQRVKEGLLVQTWQNQLANAVPPPSNEEVDKFIAEHPDLYSGRKVWLVDQIRMARPTDPTILQRLQPLTTLEQIEEFLRTNRVPAAKGTSRLDALGLPAEVSAQIAKLPPSEIFVIPNQNLLLINRIRETQVVPLVGPPARNHAQQYIRSQRTREALQRQFGGVIQQARKDVKYSKAYEPPAPAKPTAKGATKAPAAPAAAPAGASPAKAG
jgi:EpsD family peptidyl-prolyl cis-trans isomerase